MFKKIFFVLFFCLFFHNVMANHYFMGYIDDMRVYNRTYNTSSIIDLYRETYQEQYVGLKYNYTIPAGIKGGTLEIHKWHFLDKLCMELKFGNTIFDIQYYSNSPIDLNKLFLWRGLDYDDYNVIEFTMKTCPYYDKSNS